MHSFLGVSPRAGWWENEEIRKQVAQFPRLQTFAAKNSVVFFLPMSALFGRAIAYPLVSQWSWRARLQAEVVKHTRRGWTQPLRWVESMAFTLLYLGPRPLLLAAAAEFSRSGVQVNAAWSPMALFFSFFFVCLLLYHLDMTPPWRDVAGAGGQGVVTFTVAK